MHINQEKPADKINTESLKNIQAESQIKLEKVID